MENTTCIEFDRLVEKARSLGRPVRAAVAGASSENILRGVLSAKADGFIEPVLIGKGNKIETALKEIGADSSDLEIMEIDSSLNPVQYAIEMINAGHAEVLVRSDTQTRDFLLPVLSKANHLVEDDGLVTHVVFLRVPGYPKLLAVSDVTLLLEAPVDLKKEVIKNEVRALKLLGIEHPNIALLSLIETPAFHMRDTVEDQTMVREHQKRPIADCNLVGPIPYDLIVSKEAARLKKYDCPYCGEFDGIVVPNLLSGNLIVKILMQNAGAFGFGILTGTKIPVSISGRSEPPEQTYLSLAACATMLAEK